MTFMEYTLKVLEITSSSYPLMAIFIIIFGGAGAAVMAISRNRRLLRLANIGAEERLELKRMELIDGSVPNKAPAISKPRKDEDY